MSPETPFRIVAIDGPAGAGKSTVAREVARRLGFLYLDTGALYRAVTLWVQRKGLDLEGSRGVEQALSKLEVRLDEQGRVFLSGRDVSREIRTPEVAARVSEVAALPEVRARMVAIQRGFGAGGGAGAGARGVVAEGRDIGTVVFPQARFKFFLSASLEERARRRQKEFVRDGEGLSLAEVAAEIARRDERDSRREHSPLRKADDAVEIDTTGLNIAATVEAILARIGSV